MTLKGVGTGRVPNSGNAAGPLTDNFTHNKGVTLDESHLRRLVETITTGFPPTGVRFTISGGTRRRKNLTRTKLDALIATVRQDNTFGRIDRLIIEARSDGKDARKITVELREYKVIVSAEASDEEWISGRFTLLSKQLKAAQRRPPVFSARAAVQCPIGALLGLGVGLGSTMDGSSPLGKVMVAAVTSVIGAMVGFFSSRRARTVIKVEPNGHGTGSQTGVVVQSGATHRGEGDPSGSVTRRLLGFRAIRTRSTAPWERRPRMTFDSSSGARPAPVPEPTSPAYRTSDGCPMPSATMLPITIYLSDQQNHEQVEIAVEDLLAAAGLAIWHRDDPVEGSWFRRVWAYVRVAATSPAARTSVATAAHAVETRVSLSQDAAYTAMLLQNVGPVLTALHPTKDAVLRIGAVLIVKVEWAVTVYQLSATQQLKLDHEIDLAKSPQEIIAALNLQPTQQAVTQRAATHCDTVSKPTLD